MFTFFITHNRHKRSNSFLKTVSCTLGTVYRFAWYILSPGCNSISTGLVFRVPNVSSNSNSYVYSILCNTSRSSSAIFNDTLRKSDFSWWASNIRCVRRVASWTCSLSHSSSWCKVYSLECSYNIMVVTYFIGAVYPSYTPPFPLIVYLRNINIFEVRTICHVLESYRTYGSRSIHPYGSFVL